MHAHIHSISDSAKCLWIEGVAWSVQRIPTAVKSRFSRPGSTIETAEIYAKALCSNFSELSMKKKKRPKPSNGI
jgi:hypothetical protein